MESILLQNYQTIESGAHAQRLDLLMIAYMLRF